MWLVKKPEGNGGAEQGGWDDENDPGPQGALLLLPRPSTVTSLAAIKQSGVQW